MTAEEKRTLYFDSHPDVYRLYCEIKAANDNGESNEAAFRQIKQYAIDHTEFYKDYTIDSSFPIMTKLDFIRYKEAISSNETFLKPMHVSSTSGSTGIPLSVIQNYDKRIRTIADLKVFGEYALYPSHEKMLQLRAFNGKILDRTVDERENIWRYDISNLSDENIENLISFILEWKPSIIFGYVSTLDIISSYILKSKKHFAFPCKSILVGSENLTEAIAQKIRAVFSCPIFDRYSNMEMGIYAQREYGKTTFRVNHASYYFEVVKLDSDEPAKEHEIGRLIFTDLYNHAFPMIRYDTGDLGSFCVNGTQKEIEQVYGRRIDCIYDVNGNLLSPHSVSNIMWGINNVEQWQFVQKNHGTYLVKLIADGSVDEADILRRLKSVLGDAASIMVEYVADIPVLSSQKRKDIVNEFIRPIKN